VGAGITVTEVTNANDVGGSWNTYGDIPTYSSPANVLVYNYGGNPAAVASANLDGTSAQVITGSAQGTQVQLTADGKFAYYQGQNTDGSADVYAVPISQSGTCQQNRWSQRNMIAIAPAPALIISTASFDSKSGHNVIAFSEGSELHEVRDDGTALPDLTLGDPENQDVFHRMRLNPVFPDILWYKRDQPAPNPTGAAQPEIWIVNLQSPNTVYSVTGSIAADHASWSNDGTKLGYIYNGFWYQADVLNSDGSFNLTGGAFTLTEIGPTQSSGYTVNYCNLSPDGSVYVCSESYRAIYLMSLDGTQVKFLASPDSSPTGAIYNGIPKPRFLDMQHIIFSSDRTGSPQVYVITGFTTTFP
jgi:Tol biopolymer transport system component